MASSEIAELDSKASKIYADIAERSPSIMTTDEYLLIKLIDRTKAAIQAAAQSQQAARKAQEAAEAFQQAAAAVYIAVGNKNAEANQAKMLADEQAANVKRLKTALSMQEMMLQPP